MKHDVDGVEHNHTDADYDECLNTLEAFAKNSPHCVRWTHASRPPRVSLSP